MFKKTKNKTLYAMRLQRSSEEKKKKTFGRYGKVDFYITSISAHLAIFFIIGRNLAYLIKSDS